jgi:endonuclease/exonuclease/phosphatase family metal-dependent hydrolase
VSARLRLVTANLSNGRADAGAFAAMVADLGADVVAVQELSVAQADALALVLPHGKLEPARDYNGMGIALREPAPVSRVPMPHRDGWLAEVPLDGGEPLEVVNVHVLAPHALPIPRSFLVRRGQLRALEQHLDASPRARRVVLGDLNSSPLWPFYRRLARRLRDAADEAARRHGGRPARTWGPVPGGPRLYRIDHALVAGVEVVAVRVAGVRGSDHAALVVDVQAPARAPVDPREDPRARG